jgi:hypothetical protein
MSETTETVEEPRGWLLTDDELAATREKIARLNDRAARKGLAGRLAVETKRVEITEELAGGLEVTRIGWETLVTGEAPCYSGWRFIAVLDWDPAAGLITRCAPGFEGQVNREVLRPNWCDHCGTTRNRYQTMLVEHAETGERKQVGSSCIKDFLGHQASVVKFFEDADDLNREMDGFGGGDRAYHFRTESVLAVAWAVIQEFGFVRSDDWYKTPTKSDVATILYPPHNGEAKRAALELARKLQPHVDQAAGQAALIREYILSDAFAGPSEYVVNLKAMMAAETVSPQHLGLVCSAPQAWAKSVERDLIRRAEKTEVVDGYLADPKAKVELTATVKSIRYISGQYSTSTLYTMVTSTGHLVKWFSTAGALGNEVTGTVFTLAATVKSHDDYQGTKSTVITRAKVLSKA